MENAPGTQAAQTGAVTESRPIQAVADYNGDQLEKLSILIAQLEERLAYVRNGVPSNSETNESQDLPQSSGFASQLASQTFAIQRLQTRVQTLLNELEV